MLAVTLILYHVKILAIVNLSSFAFIVVEHHCNPFPCVLLSVVGHSHLQNRSCILFYLGTHGPCIDCPLCK